MFTIIKNAFNKIERNYKLIVVFWIIWKVTTTIVTILGTIYINRDYLLNPVFQNIYKLYTFWDSRFFYEIVQSGYITQGEFSIRTAFFPVYPIFIKAFSYIFGGNIELSQYFVANLSFLTWILLLYYFIKNFINKDKTIAYYTAILAIVFPYNLFFMAGYAESTFMVFVMLFFICFYQKKFWWAAVFMGIAATTRLVGLGLIVILLIGIIRENVKLSTKLIKLIIAPIIALLPFGAYLLYLQLKIGRWNEFLLSHESFGRKIQFDFISRFYNIIVNNIKGDHHSILFINDVFNFLLTFIAIGISIFFLIKYKKYFYFGLFILLMIAPAIVNGMTMSLARVTIVCFPVYYFFALLHKKYSIPIYFLIVPVVAIQIILILTFNAGNLSKFIG